VTSRSDPPARRPGKRRRRNVIVQLLQPFTEALFTGKPEPPHRRTGWLARRAARFLPFPDLDPVFWLDTILALILAAGVWFTVDVIVGDGEAFLVAALLTLGLPGRSQWPFAAWRLSVFGRLYMVVAASDVMYETAAGPVTAIVMVLCLYSVVVRGTQSIMVGAWLVTGLTLALATSFGLPGGVLLSSAAALLGYNVRVRRQTQSRLAVTEQLHAEDRAAVAVLEERSRIARELHDVVAHHMSIIAIQAEAAPLQNPGAPAPMVDSFAQIRTTALEALSETRRILGVLRDTGTSAELAPAPDVDQINEIIAGARAAGVSVSLRTHGTARPVPSGVGLSAYRIVQESLSNAMRHAPGADVYVLVEYVDDPTELRITVRNDQPRNGGAPLPGPDGNGNGLVGMRERVAMLGGGLTAAPTVDGGFAVSATLPLERT
jgi:signal transduction histidine kinase